METGETKFRQDKCSRWLFFFIGVLLAASIGLAIALGITLGKKDNDDDKVNSTVSEHSQGICTTPACVVRAGEVLQAMDKAVNPCDDLYEYSCGNWLKTHHIPEGKSSYSRYSKAVDTVKWRLKELLEKPFDSARENSAIRKAKYMYQSCMDEDKLQQNGATPIRALVRQLASWPLMSPNTFDPSQMDLESLLVSLGLLNIYPLFGVVIGRDDLNSSQNVIQIDKPSSDAVQDYMLKGREPDLNLNAEQFLRQQAVHVLGLTPSPALNDAIRDVLQFRTQLLQLSANETASQDEEDFNKVTIAELSAAIPEFDWMKFLSSLFGAAKVTITEDTEVFTKVEDYLKAMLDLYEKTDKRTVANYLLMRIVDTFNDYLSKEIRDVIQPQLKVLLGKTQIARRWETCVEILEKEFMPDAIGQLYISTYFPSSAKQKADEMIGQIRQSMKEMINNVHWMDAATKVKAMEKADAIIEKIGYPDYLLNDTALEEMYSEVDFKPDTYFQNAVDATRFGVIQSAKTIKETPSKEDWIVAATTVNAFYAPNDNSITFPAGIMQSPFYVEDFPQSMMFGAIGFIIGHEITHGFDDTGRKFDKDGNKRVWWSQSSSDNFKRQASCFVRQYSQQKVAGVQIDGNLTLGENIADNGGIKAAFMAFQSWQALNGKQPLLPGLGLTHEQLFFVSFAQVQCSLDTEQGLRNKIPTDAHSPIILRVRLTPSNSEAFAKAFGCPAGSKMNPADKCVLW